MASSTISEETKNLFVQNFPTLTNDETENFMNFLYPSQQGTFADLVPNKQYTHALLEKIFTSVVTNNNAVFIIDNFELTDNASFEFIKQMILSGIINNKTNQNQVPVSPKKMGKTNSQTRLKTLAQI